MLNPTLLGDPVVIPIKYNSHYKLENEIDALIWGDAYGHLVGSTRDPIDTLSVYGECGD